MPAKKKKKGAKKKRTSANKSEDPVTLTDPFPRRQYTPAPPLYDVVKNLLSEDKVNEKDVLGIKIPMTILDHLTPMEIRDLKMVFDSFDLSETGAISARDVKRAMRSLGFKVSFEDVTQYVSDVDNAGRGTISLVDFLRFVISRQGDSRDVYDELVQGFKMMDSDVIGTLSVAKLVEINKDLGLKMSEADIRGMVDIADLNGDGEIDQDEFISIMLKTSLF